MDELTDAFISVAVATSNAILKPTMIRAGKISWWGGQSIMQNFPLPDSIIYYIAKNPTTSEAYNKLIQTNKYFFETNPILVAPKMYGSRKLCSNESCDGSSDKCCVKINFKKLKSKIWLKLRLHLYAKTTRNFTTLLPAKLYRCDITEFSASNRNINYDDFLALISPTLKQIYFHDVRISYKDKKLVMLDTIFALFNEKMPNIECFSFTFMNKFPMTNAATVKNILNLKNLGRLNLLQLANVPEIIDPDDLSTLLKTYKNIRFWLYFSNNVSEGYKAQLDALIETVIQSEITYRLIYYDGQDDEKLKIMRDRYGL